MENNLKQIFNQFSLGKSLFRSVHRISNLEVENTKLSKELTERMIKNEISLKLAKEIVKEKYDSIKTYAKPDYQEFSLEVLVIDLPHFKSVVEGAISLMPQSEIDRIRNNQY